MGRGRESFPNRGKGQGFNDKASYLDLQILLGVHRCSGDALSGSLGGWWGHVPGKWQRKLLGGIFEV